MTRLNPKPALIADLFCGAGGSSTGAKRALDRLGRGMVLTCVNHWPIAIETHSRNHPEARHYVQDIASVRPAEVVPEGYLDLLMASPTCTHHSRARGGKPTSDQQRSDPWHVVTWLTELRVKRLLIENVPEFEDWGPVDPRSGKPLKSRKGEYFQAWVRALKGLGFRVEWRVINSADMGAYTTRQRLYLIARSDGKKIVWPEPTHSKNGVAQLFGGGAKWKPARDIIDWQNKGTSIFARKKPLADKTIARIMAGAKKFAWPEPFMVILRGTQPGQVDASAKSVDVPVPALSAGGGHVAVVEQTLQPFVFANRTNNVAQSIDGPVPSIVTTGNIWVAQPEMVPFVIGQHGGAVARDTAEPLPTVAAAGAISLTQPIIAPYYGSGSGETCKSIDLPLDTLTAKARFGLVEPCVLTVAYGAWDGGADAARRAHNINAPLPPLTASGTFGIVEPVATPFLLNRASEGYGGTRAHSIDEPTPTATCSGAGYLVEAVVSEPLIVHTDNTTAKSSYARSAGDPLYTITTNDRHGLVNPVITQIGRPFIVPHFGEREGQQPRTHSTDAPLPTVTGQGAGSLIEAVIAFAAAEDEGFALALKQGRVFLIDGQLYIFDILFRMLDWPELARAMGFSDEDFQYEFAGTKADITRQIGNAVEVNTAEALVHAVMST